MNEILAVHPDLSFKGGYHTVYRNAKRFYMENWRGNEIPSPAFDNQKVLMSKKFFKHIVSKAASGQYLDVVNRLRQLPNVKQILETSSEIFGEARRQDGMMLYSILGQVEGGKVIEVIVSRHRTHNEFKLHTFYSINAGLLRFSAGKENEIARVQKLFTQPITRMRSVDAAGITGRVLDIEGTSVAHNLIIDLGNKLAWVSVPSRMEMNIKPGVIIELKQIIGRAKEVDLKIKR